MKTNPELFSFGAMKRRQSQAIEVCAFARKSPDHVSLVSA
jgi:hypothetical protein